MFFTGLNRFFAVQTNIIAVSRYDASATIEVSPEIILIIAIITPTQGTKSTHLKCFLFGMKYHISKIRFSKHNTISNPVNHLIESKIERKMFITVTPLSIKKQKIICLYSAQFLIALVLAQFLAILCGTVSPLIFKNLPQKHNFFCEHYNNYYIADVLCLR